MTHSHSTGGPTDSSEWPVLRAAQSVNERHRKHRQGRRCLGPCDGQRMALVAFGLKRPLAWRCYETRKFLPADMMIVMVKPCGTTFLPDTWWNRLSKFHFQVHVMFVGVVAPVGLVNMFLGQKVHRNQRGSVCIICRFAGGQWILACKFNIYIWTVYLQSA